MVLVVQQDHDVPAIIVITPRIIHILSLVLPPGEFCTHVYTYTYLYIIIFSPICMYINVFLVFFLFLLFLLNYVQCIRIAAFTNREASLNTDNTLRSFLLSHLEDVGFCCCSPRSNLD